jgi:integrase
MWWVVVRRKKEPGELGKVRCYDRGGFFQARGMVRDGAGQLHNISARGSTPEEARERLEARANAVWDGMFLTLSPDSTVAEVTALWLAEVNDSDHLQPSTKEGYAFTARKQILTRIGAIPVRRMDPGACHMFLKNVASEHSASYVHTTRSVLSSIMGFALLHRAVPSNPLREVPDMRRAEPHYIEWDFEQVQMIFKLMREWKGVNPGRRGGGVADMELLTDMALIMLGTSMRPGEALGIRRQDVKLVGDRAVVNLVGTVTTTRADGTTWKPIPKRKSQQRAITVPPFAASVLRRRMANYRDNEFGLLFITRTGKPRPAHNINRTLRSFREAHADVLRGIGVEPADLTSRAYRKMAARTIADTEGMDLAASLLGHSDSRTTRGHYAKPNRVVPSRTADILEEQFPFDAT